jgi:SAM-dependent methyltransferase
MMTDKELRLRKKVCDAYSAAAESPESKHPFPVGRRFAESLGYPSELLDELPAVASEAFSGVSNVAVFAELPEGATVLDLGCGAGLDSLIAGRRVGVEGSVTSVDFGETMLERARIAVREAHLPNVFLTRAAAESLPLHTASVDVAIVNGIFNLNPARSHIFRELSRVVRKGGAVYAAELILKDPLPSDAQQSEDDWFA